MIEQAKFAYSLSGKVFEKHTKTIEEQRKMEMTAIEDRGKQLAESNKLIKKDLNIDRGSIPLDEQKIYLINVLQKNLMNLII